VLFPDPVGPTTLGVLIRTQVERLEARRLTQSRSCLELSLRRPLAELEASSPGLHFQTVLMPVPEIYYISVRIMWINFQNPNTTRFRMRVR
jgi:hypothetical protein